jgi:aryl-alcohol dehydrogenase-like predicted oxidoreductase
MPRRHVPGLSRPVSAIGAGCWTIGGPASNRGVPIGWDRPSGGTGPNSDGAAADGLLHAYELGITLYDTADVYGLGHSERLLGRLLTQVSREAVTVCSKVGYFTGTAAHPYTPVQMRNQLRTTLANLHTDHLDLYCLHSSDFGPGDEYLPAAVEQMNTFQAEGLIRAVGMRAPHQFAQQWAQHTRHPHATPVRRFLHLYRAIQPDVLIARHSLLSPLYAPDETDIFDFAHAHGIGVIIKQALGQGLLLCARNPDASPAFSPGDHRSRDPYFRAEIRDAIYDAMTAIRIRFGHTPTDLARVAIQYALHRDRTAPVLVGFRDAAQIHTAATSLHAPLTDDEIAYLRQLAAPLRAIINPDIGAPALRQGEPR